MNMDTLAKQSLEAAMKITGTDGKLPFGYSGEWQLFFEQ